MYGVSAMSRLFIEGAIATAVLVTGAISTPVAPTLVLDDSSSQSLNVSVVPSCDSGSIAISYEYEVHGANMTSSSYFACCNFVINDLQPDASFIILVRITNEFGSSPWTTAHYRTRTGIPSEPSFSVLTASSNSITLVIADSSPADDEIEGYEVNVYFEGTLVWEDVNECTEAASESKWICDRSLLIKNLSPSTTYNVFLRAHGPLGSSPWIYQDYQTKNISTGKKFREFPIRLYRICVTLIRLHCQVILHFLRLSTMLKMGTQSN